MESAAVAWKARSFKVEEEESPEAQVVGSMAEQEEDSILILSRGVLCVFCVCDHLLFCYLLMGLSIHQIHTNSYLENPGFFVCATYIHKCTIPTFNGTDDSDNSRSYLSLNLQPLTTWRIHNDNIV